MLVLKCGIIFFLKLKNCLFINSKRFTKTFFCTIIMPKQPHNIILFYKNYYCTSLNTRFYQNYALPNQYLLAYYITIYSFFLNCFCFFMNIKNSWAAACREDQWSLRSCLLLVQGDPKKTEPNSNYSKYTGSVFFGSPCIILVLLYDAFVIASWQQKINSFCSSLPPMKKIS